MVVVTTAFLLTATHAVTSLWRLIDRHTDRHTDRQVERQTERARETKLMATVRRTIDDNLQSPKTGSSIPITVDVHCRSYICVSIASAHDVAFTLYIDAVVQIRRWTSIENWMYNAEWAFLEMYHCLASIHPTLVNIWVHSHYYDYIIMFTIEYILCL